MALKRSKNLYHTLFLELGIVWVFMFFYRLVFVFKNATFFPEFGYKDYLVGSWFDLITIAFFYLPFLFFSTVPFPFKLEKFRKGLKSVLFIPATFLIFFLNAWDIAFFSFTRKRISYHYFKFIVSENEAGVLAPDFISEFWWLILFFIFSLGLVIYWFLKCKQFKCDFRKRTSWIFFILTLFTSIIIGRGGFQLKPVDIIEVSKYTSLKNAPAALNSAFTILKTFNYVGLEKKSFFSDAQADEIFNPMQQTRPAHILRDSSNVVLIIFESFGSMYVGPDNEESYTPFLDSVLSESMFFEYGVSNGQSSMDAVPAIVASIPSWMKESFILSSYSMNQYNSLPSVLARHGYSSSFFHGPTNGSMRFDSFTLASGFDQYLGRTEYNNEDHFDGTWGIPDHHFLPWTVDEMSKMVAPFFSTIFTYSSHHPYTIPDDFKDITRAGPDLICKSISYADFAFRDFWNKVKKQKWFDNTLFVFCADHVGPTKRKDRSNLEWSFRIPIAFYHPGGMLPDITKKESMQQIDIMPTILDLLNIDTKYFSVGSSYFNPKRMPKMSYYQNNIVSMSPTARPLIWNELETDSVNDGDQETIRKIKAIYQQYIAALVDNRMIP